jgi:hypothetical protein
MKDAFASSGSSPGLRRKALPASTPSFQNKFKFESTIRVELHPDVKGKP